jgi:hypothetical protein
MECEFCGEEISEGALACPRCGSPAPKPDVTAKAPSVTGVPGAQGTPPASQAEPPRLEERAAPPAQAGTPTARPGPPVAPPPASPPPSQQSAPPWESPSPPATPPGPGEVPLARQEEDFIALAEEMVAESPPVGEPVEAAPQSPAGVVNPALPDERVELDGTLTGGFKGETAGGASVAGAGEQTADDPFGLNITETAPPVAAEAEAGRRFNFRSWWNILMMFVALLVAGAVAFVGVYFGFLREKGLSPKEPVAAVQEYIRQVVSGDTSTLSSVSVPGSAYQSEIVNALKPYEKQGVISVKEFDADTTSMNDTTATVSIRKLTVEILTTGDTTERVDLLALQPPLRNTVNLVRQNDRWLVSN